MRWKTAKSGDTRIIKHFPLIFPYEINNEARLWETVYIFQHFKQYLHYAYWDDICFTTKEEYKNYKKEKKNGKKSSY